MVTKEEIVELLQEYLLRFRDEKKRCSPLIQFLSKHEGDQLIHRKNFSGHITSSAFIIDKSRSQLLLLKHRSLKRWLQPGGHVDLSDLSLIDSAIREACEETGFQNDQLILISGSIFDIDSHMIPENPNKHEPAHVHHDIRFLFECSISNSLNISAEEFTDSKWYSWGELKKNPDFAWVEDKVRKYV